MTTTCPSFFEGFGKRKCFTYVGLEGSSIGGTFHAHRCSAHPLFAHSSDQRYVLIPVSRNLTEGPLSSGSPGVKPRQSDVGPAFVHEYKLCGVYVLHLISPSTSLFFVSFGGTQTLFLSVQPSLWRIARDIVEMETLSHCLTSHSWQCLSKVASSCSSSCFHKALLCSTLWPMEKGRLG